MPKKKTNFSKIDIFIGALEENLITKKHLIATRSYYYERITWCVQKSQPIPLWKNIFYLCNDPLVYLIPFMLGILVYCIGYYCEQFERHPKWDWFKFTINGFGCMLGMPCTYNPTITATRIGILLCLFSAIIFVSLISAALMQLVMTPILNPQIKSVQEIIAGSFKLVGNRFLIEKISQQKEVNA